MSYDIRPAGAFAILDRVDGEREQIDAAFQGSISTVADAGSAAAPAAPVAAALGRFGGHLAAQCAQAGARIGLAGRHARSAVSAYVAGDQEMAAEYAAAAGVFDGVQRIGPTIDPATHPLPAVVQGG